MTRSTTRRTVAALLAACLCITGSLPVTAGPRAEFREGLGEIARERWEMQRDILGSGTRDEARRAFKNGMREISRERREMRREMRREIRRRYFGRVVAGVVLGTVIAVSIAGRPPRPPRPDLCWYWSDGRRLEGYWYYCREPQ